MPSPPVPARTPWGWGYEAGCMTLVLGGGLVLNRLGGVPWFNPAILAAGVAQAMTLIFGRIVGVRGRYVPGLLLFLGAYALEEAREGRGTANHGLLVGLIVLLVGLALVRLRLSLVPGSELPDDPNRTAWEATKPWLGHVALPVLLTLLGLYSAKAGGAGQMTPWFSWLRPETAWAIVVAIRKTIHSTFYPLLALGALAAYGRVRPDLRANAPWVLAFTLIFATFDEVRQSGVPGRNGSPWDVLLDMTAATIVVALVVWRFGSRPDARLSQDR